MLILVRIAAYPAVSVILGSVDVMVTDWQWWAIMFSMAVVHITSAMD